MADDKSKPKAGDVLMGLLTGPYAVGRNTRADMKARKFFPALGTALRTKLGWLWFVIHVVVLFVVLLLVTGSFVAALLVTLAEIAVLFLIGVFV